MLKEILSKDLRMLITDKYLQNEDLVVFSPCHLHLSLKKSACSKRHLRFVEN